MACEELIKGEEGKIEEEAEAEGNKKGKLGNESQRDFFKKLAFQFFPHVLKIKRPADSIAISGV